jgi:hypothetical protein
VRKGVGSCDLQYVPIFRLLPKRTRMATRSTAGRNFPFDLDRGALAAFALARSAQLRMAGPGHVFPESAARKAMRIALALLLVPGISLAGQHSVGLSWTASVDASGNPSLTYTLYRQTHASGGGQRLERGDLGHHLDRHNLHGYHGECRSLLLLPGGGSERRQQCAERYGGGDRAGGAAHRIDHCPDVGEGGGQSSCKPVRNLYGPAPQYATNWEFYDSTGKTLAKGTAPLETVDITETWKGKDSAAAYYFKVCDSQQCLTQQATASG